MKGSLPGNLGNRSQAHGKEPLHRVSNSIRARFSGTLNLGDSLFTPADLLEGLGQIFDFTYVRAEVTRSPIAFKPPLHGNRIQIGDKTIESSRVSVSQRRVPAAQLPESVQKDHMCRLYSPYDLTINRMPNQNFL